jgi:hypothetical protein
MTTRRWIVLALMATGGMLVLCCGLLAGYRWLNDPKAVVTPVAARVYPTLPSPTVMPQTNPTPTPDLDPTALPSPTRLPPTETLLAEDTPTPPPVLDTLVPPDTPTVQMTASLPPTRAMATIPLPTQTRAELPSPVSLPTESPKTPATPAGNQPPWPPQESSSWDMEAGFVPGTSPLGEDCPGWSVAADWQAFLAPGTPASSCLNENKCS